MSVTFDDMTIADYDGVLGLWRRIEGVGLGETDSRENVQRHLSLHPGLSLLARDGGQIVGSVLCGHDGRRGYLHHLALAPSHRGQGLARTMVEACLRALAERGIDKCHVMVLADNRDGMDFWKAIGWSQRTDLIMFSKYTTGTGP